MSGIVLYGGTFNPIHLGHIAICRRVYEELSPDRLILMPAAAPPHKDTPNLVSGEDRREMCILACEGMDYVSVDDFELLRGGRSYTIDTLRHLRGEYPDTEIYLLVGTDMFLTFDQWKNWREIGQIATVVAASRRNDDIAELCAKREALARDGVRSIILNNEVVEMSSTDIRAQLAAQGFSAGLSPLVMGYIWEHGLYGAEMTAEALRQLIRPMMKESRYIHSLGVEKAAVMLARRFGADERKAAIAGILHDICKYTEPSAALQLIKDSGIITDIDFAAQPQLLHSYAGSVYIRRLGIRDEDIINAVRYHTTGRADMSTLEKVIYLADLISEERDYPDVEEMRSCALHSLDEGMAYALRYMVEKQLPAKGQACCGETMAAYRCYCKEKEEP